MTFDEQNAISNKQDYIFIKQVNNFKNRREKNVTI